MTNTCDKSTEYFQ